MPEQIPHDRQPLPESEVVFQDTSIDGKLTITVWRDFGPLTDLMVETGAAAMGILRIYDTRTGELLHEERVPLSETSLLGSGPSSDEVEYWSSLIVDYTPEE